MQRFAFLRLGAGYASPSYRQGTGERELGGKGIETSGPSVSFQAFLTQFFLGEGGPESLRALPVARPSGPAVGPPAFASALRGSGRWLPRAAAVGGRQRARGARGGGGAPPPLRRDPGFGGFCDRRSGPRNTPLEWKRRPYLYANGGGLLVGLFPLALLLFFLLLIPTNSYFRGVFLGASRTPPPGSPPPATLPASPPSPLLHSHCLSFPPQGTTRVLTKGLLLGFF